MEPATGDVLVINAKSFIEEALRKEIATGKTTVELGGLEPRLREMGLTTWPLRTDLR